MRELVSFPDLMWSVALHAKIFELLISYVRIPCLTGIQSRSCKNSPTRVLQLHRGLTLYDFSSRYHAVMTQQHTSFKLSAVKK